jgi:hypothetical protein
MKVGIDADGLVYLVGFAHESSDYRVVFLDEKDEVKDVIVVSGLAEVRALDAQLEEGERIEVEHLVTEEPLEHALGSTKRTLLSIEHALRVNHGLSFPRMDLFLTGTTNFRDDYARIRPYKGNRAEASRPVHYEAIRAYLTNRWGAVTVEGIEADDALAMMAHVHGYDPNEFCIVSMDKDLKTVPGRLYNFRKKGKPEAMRIITPGEARMNFYRQMLTGDPTDNVLGCYKTGAKTAAQIVTASQTEVESAQAVLDEFRASVKRKGCPYAETHRPEEAMMETGILLHMRRTPGEIWRIPNGVS